MGIALDIPGGGNPQLFTSCAFAYIDSHTHFESNTVDLPSAHYDSSTYLPFHRFTRRAVCFLHYFTLYSEAFDSYFIY